MDNPEIPTLGTTDVSLFPEYLSASVDKILGVIHVALAEVTSPNPDDVSDEMTVCQEYDVYGAFMILSRATSERVKEYPAYYTAMLQHYYTELEASE